MGSSQVKTSPDTNSPSDSSPDMEDASCNGLNLKGFLLSPEILSYILAFVPDQDLVSKCRVVCRVWRQIIDEHAIWKLKCDRRKLIYPRCLQNIPQHFYRTICLKNPFGRNLIKNPNGKEKFKYWHYENGGDGWAIEDPPEGADLLTKVEELKDITSCFATSYGKCSKYQTVNLVKEGCLPEILDELQPTISVSEWYAARFDCASRYCLIVSLLDKSRNVIDKFEHGPVDEVQWVGRAWHKVEHKFENYGPGVRFIGFHHYGHDLQFWAGYYGSKMTGSTVKLIANN